MTNLRKAAEMALKALEANLGKWAAKTAAVEALRQALAQSEQEPVGYVSESGKGAYILLAADLDDGAPLYAAPPKREWVGLTDEERDFFKGLGFVGTDMIEAKLKEKNT